MKKENGFIKFLLVLIVIALSGIIMLFGYVMYNEFTGKSNDVIFGNLESIYSKLENQGANNKVDTKLTSDTKLSVDTSNTQFVQNKEYQNNLKTV